MEVIKYHKRTRNQRAGKFRRWIGISVATAGKWAALVTLIISVQQLGCAVDASKREALRQKALEVAGNFVDVPTDYLKYDGSEDEAIGEIMVFSGSKPRRVEVKVETKSMSVIDATWWDWFPDYSKKPVVDRKGMITTAREFLSSHAIEPPKEFKEEIRGDMVFYQEYMGDLRGPSNICVSVNRITGSIYGFGYRMLPTTVSTSPDISKEQAIAAAAKLLPRNIQVDTTGENNGITTELHLSQGSKKDHWKQRLMWRVWFHGVASASMLGRTPPGYRAVGPGYIVEIDAHSGDVVSQGARTSYWEPIEEQETRKAVPLGKAN